MDNTGQTLVYMQLKEKRRYYGNSVTIENALLNNEFSRWQF